MRALLVDDESLARERLKLLLADELDIVVASEARDGLEALEALKPCLSTRISRRANAGMTELEVAAAVGVQHLPPTIFITAYQEHAAEAFRLACCHKHSFTRTSSKVGSTSPNARVGRQ